MDDFSPQERVLPALIAQRARETPDRPFLSDVDGQSASFGELHEAGQRWARALMRAGVRPGDLVSTMLYNSVENYAIWLGIAWAGAVEVPINVDLRGAVLVHQLSTAGPALLIAAPSAVPNIVVAAPQVSSLRQLVVVPGPLSAAGPASVGRDEFLADLDGEPSRPYADLAPHDIASVMYTSGTTGPSKGVLMPWAQLHAGSLLSADMIAAGPSLEKAIYVTGPPNHVSSKGAVAAMAVLSGRVLLRHAFSGTRFWADVRAHAITDTVLVGAMANFLLAAPPAPDDADTTLSNVLMAPVIPAVDAFNARFGTRAWSAYNMTEISVPTLLPEWQAGDVPNCGAIRPGYPYYEARIVDGYDYEVAPGAVGELILRTGAPWTLNSGYLNMPEATLRTWRNGWFHTGDAFRQDERGRFHFVDRMKDTIRRRGENISSFEVEAEVVAHPGVSECAAVAVPADEIEDEIKIVVVRAADSALDAETLVAYLVERVPRFMVPRFVQFVDALPKTPTLRVQKAGISRSTSAADGVYDRGATPATGRRRGSTMP